MTNLTTTASMFNARSTRTASALVDHLCANGISAYRRGELVYCELLSQDVDKHARIINQILARFSF